MSELELSEFADKVGELMPVIMKEFARHQSGEFYKTKITMPQFFVLDMLKHNGGSKMSDMARFLNVTTAAMTGIVGRLVRDGYVMRLSDPKDRRIIKVDLTAKGAKVIKDMVERRKQITMKIFSSISSREREDYLNILAHVGEHLRKKQ
jgi:MarR family transcriptional regulator, organic hydroperoxide resistance regulator